MTNNEAIRFASCLMDNSVVNDNDMELFCDMAIEALEKQIAKKPNITSMKLIGGEVLTHYSVCPECGDALTIGYPCKCGQMIDWEDDNGSN